jgi:hypothetical protein
LIESTMTKHEQDMERDPLGLAKLPMLEPPEDGWEPLRAALEAERRESRGMGNGARAGHGPFGGPSRAPFAWALAASLVLALGALVVLRQLPPTASVPEPLAAGDSRPGSEEVSQEAADPTSLPDGEPMTVGNLVVLSQRLETRLRDLRSGSGPLSGETAIYVAEIEDLITQVDGALSASPESIDLWGQRVNLLLDLQAIYRHHWEQEYRWLATR